MSEETIDYRKLAEALAEALEQRNLWIEGEEYRELVILRMRLSARVDSFAEELKAATDRIAECESALISMVQQFFYNKDGEDAFRHAFMSAEEEAATYLVEHGIACWTDDYKSAIRFIVA